jgi:Recombinase zinc beta ribbon domain
MPYARCSSSALPSVKPHRCGRCGLAMTGDTNNHSRYYCCSSHQTKTDPAQRCRGTIRGEEAERRVWEAIIQILDHPELVTAEVAKQQATIEDQDSALASELAAIEAALTRCEQDGRRLVEGYVAGEFTAEELKAYRADVVTRRQTLEGERQEVCSKRNALQQARGQTEALETYCMRVRDRLTTFSVEEQQLPFDALAVTVRWMPGEPLRIEASIPLDGIASQPAHWDRCRCRHPW